MKKFFHILFINAIIFFVCLCILEFICICKAYETMKHDKYPFKYHLINIIQSYKHQSYIDYDDLRPTSFPKEDSGKNPLAVMGCSYAYGLFLENNETLSARLSELTGRTVFNMGMKGASAREILYIFRNEDISNQLFDNRTDIEYVFYPYISHHRFRLLNQAKAFAPSPSFKRKGDRLEFYEPNKFITNTQLYKKITEIRYFVLERKSSLELMFLYLKEINREMKKRFPNATFVLLLYEDYLREDWSELEKDGIIVIRIEDLAQINTKDPQYTKSPTDPHPNARAWEVIAPKLVEKLNL